MKIFVTVKTKAHREKILKIDATHYVVCVREVPEKGKANVAVLKSISEHLNIPKSHIKITSGFASKQKSIEIPLLNK